jgi:hypothetical protein
MLTVDQNRVQRLSSYSLITAKPSLNGTWIEGNLVFSGEIFNIQESLI